MSFIKKLKNVLIILLALFFLGVIFILFQDTFSEFKYFVGYSLSPQYKKDRELIKPYFDEKFYLSHYGEAVKKSGLDPIDHFLKRGWYSGNWRNHTDPNSWFNTTLYQERLWNYSQSNYVLISSLRDILRIKTNPFVDFLTQPKLKNHNNVVEVWAKKDELTRAWLAVEGLMRLDKFNVVLHVSGNMKPEDRIRFIPQTKRGLKLLLDNKQSKSFYHSDFIRNPDKYQLTDLKPKPNTDPDEIITYVKQDFSYLMHRIYPVAWKKYGKFNPAMINIIHYHEEPLASGHFFGNYSLKLNLILKGILSGDKETVHKFRIQNFKDYLVRIADAVDLYIMDTKLPVRNLKIVPGNMETWVDGRELSKNKEFSVSFLLTKKNEKRAGWDYKMRNEIWNREKKFKIPTRFYLSLRDKDKFPKNIQNRVIPTDSKKWVFNSEFNIAMENVRQEYYFTEKLLGCFVSLTVPIYIGCPNVLDYFDSRGMIVVQSVDEIIKAANYLTPETYGKMLPYLKENKKRALRLLNLEKEVIAEFGKKLKNYDIK